MAAEAADDGGPSPELPEALLEQAIERLYAVEERQRAAVGEELVAAHPQHAAALRRLLAQVVAVERTLERAFPDTDVDPVAIGDLPVRRKLGEGAFGVVYLCEQTTPVARSVAVKVLRAGTGDRNTLRRFAAEQQLLASWTHPAITQVYDAGRLDDGRPYFVMEYVDGVPITNYCATEHLSCRDRVRLFVAACHGVSHAHASGVVHRDLKPGNVLVVDQNGRPQPKIIDFGIAKALMRDGAPPGAEATEGGRVLGTPGYMSPEQARGDVAAIDERTDVFGLGVLLYELLTGELPWPRRGSAGTEAPPLASDRLRARAKTEGGTGDRCVVEAAVRGDLDWITRKAIRHERAERYASVQAFRDDLERHLAGKPVSAGPPTWRYRMGKFVRRHRVAAAAIGTAAVFVAIGVRVAYQHSRAASEHLASATAAVESLLRRANDQQAAPNEATRVALGVDALAFYERWLVDRPDDPELRAGRCNALVTLSIVHWEVGQMDLALRRAEQARDEAEALQEAQGAEVGRLLLARACRHRARALWSLNRGEEAKAVGARALAVFADLHRQDAGRYGIEYAAALRETGNAVGFPAGRDEQLRSGELSISVLADLVARGLRIAEARAEMVSSRLTLALAQLGAGDLDGATTTIGLAEAELEHAGSGVWRLRAAIHDTQATIAGKRGDLAAAIGAYERAVSSCDAWCEHEPLQMRARYLRRHCREELAGLHDRRADWPAADRVMQRAIELAAADVEAVAEPATARRELRGLLYRCARRLWDRYRRQDLPIAEHWLRQCEDLAADPVTGREPSLPFETSALAALLSDAAGRGTGPSWERVAGLLPTFSELAVPNTAAYLVEAWLGVVRSRLSSGDTKGAIDAIAQAEAVAAAAGDLVDNDFRSQIAWHRARVCVATGDLAARSPHLAEVLRRRPTWWGHFRVGMCEFEAWRLHARGGDAEAATRAREAAVKSLQRVVATRGDAAAKAPADPWVVVPVGTARLALAEIEDSQGNRDAALASLDAGLVALDAVAAEAHADQLDSALVAAARQRQRELRALPGR